MKVKKLRQEYKKSRIATARLELEGVSGRFMIEILGNRPATCPPVIIDTLNEETLGIQVEDSDNLLENEPSPGNPEEKSARSSTPVSCGRRQMNHAM